ncbi:MAG: hypothetical protein P4M09_08930 [Devosia sp.]|nr:hypothetical protein [Devosia sp.]
MRQVLATAMAAGLVAAALGGTLPASARMAAAPRFAPGTPAEQAAYYNACLKVSPTLKAGCACRAQAAMKYSPQLRADIILSMSNPEKFRPRSLQITHDEHTEWAVFSADTAKQCGIDN